MEWFRKKISTDNLRYHLIGEKYSKIETEALMEKFEDSSSEVIRLRRLEKYFTDEVAKICISKNPIYIPLVMFIVDSDTGKSLATQLLGRVAFETGLLRSSRITEVVSMDLVGIDAASTVLKTRKKMYDAKPGILVVKDIDRLIRLRKDHATLAFQEIKKRKGEYGVLPVFTRSLMSYREEDCQFVGGIFKNGVELMLTFNAKQLAQIAQLLMKNQEEGSPFKGFKFHPECTIVAMTNLFHRFCNPSEKRKRRFNVEIMLEQARNILDARSSFKTNLMSITLKDIEKALHSVGYYM